MRCASSRCASRGLRGRHDLVPLAAQRLRQRVEDLRLVVDEQNGSGGHVPSSLTVQLV